MEDRSLRLIVDAFWRIILEIDTFLILLSNHDSISKYKNEVFILAASLLIFSFYVYWTGRKNSCPADQRQAKLCSKLRFINKIFLFASLILYVTGFFFAFIAEDIFFWDQVQGYFLVWIKRKTWQFCQVFKINILNLYYFSAQA